MWSRVLPSSCPFPAPATWPSWSTISTSTAGGLSFDILLHVGTLVALVAYFYQDWLDMAHAFISPSRYNRPERKMLFFLIVATIPGALAGVLLEKKAETIFREPARIAILLGAVGLLLILGEILARHNRPLDRITLKDAVLIGLSQAFAIMPGVSRSGITMTTGLFLGFNRRSAAHFSFLMSTPIIAGAGLHHIPKWLHEPAGTLPLLPATLGLPGRGDLQLPHHQVPHALPPAPHLHPLRGLPSPPGRGDPGLRLLPPGGLIPNRHQTGQAPAFAPVRTQAMAPGLISNPLGTFLHISPCQKTFYMNIRNHLIFRTVPVC